MSNSNGCSNESCWKFVAKSNYGPRKKQVLLSSDSEIMLHICCFDVIYSLAKLLRPELRAPRRYVRGRNWKLTPIGQGATFALTQLTYGFCSFPPNMQTNYDNYQKRAMTSEKVSNYLQDGVLYLLQRFFAISHRFYYYNVENKTDFLEQTEHE